MVVLLALLAPLGVATWFLDSVVTGNEVDKADVRLTAALRSATVVVAKAVSGADARAEALARSPRVQQALLRRDRTELARLAEARPGVSFWIGGSPVAGSVQPGSIARAVEVVRGERAVGRVVAVVPLDDALARRLSVEAQLEPDELFLLAKDDRVVAGLVGVGARAGLAPGRRGDIRLDGTRYRALAAPLPGGGTAKILAVTPRAPIDSKVAGRRWRVVLASLVTLLCIALGAYVLAPVFQRRFGFPRRERRRMLGPGQRDAREALALVGDALAATHDQRALLPVILETMIEATGAVGGRLLADGREVARAGSQDEGAEPLTLELGGEDVGWEGLLVLHPPPGGFSDEARELAQWLASQASIALENARLHAIVKQQAVTDALTGLANRRRFIEELAEEVSRAERFGGPLAVVLADLDDFKGVNDRYGHQTGDEVLRAFAAVLRDRLREVDLPARIGGEEFAILLRETDLAGGKALAEQLRARLAGLRLTAPDGRQLAVTASFGVTAYPQAQSEDELLSVADAALYRAKALGKNRVVAAGSEAVSEGRAADRGVG